MSLYMTIDKKNIVLITQWMDFSKKNSSYFLIDNPLLQHNHGLWPKFCHLIFNCHLLFKVKIQGKGESTLWGTSFGHL
jgi:hypothetical protein